MSSLVYVSIEPKKNRKFDASFMYKIHNIISKNINMLQHIVVDNDMRYTFRIKSNSYTESTDNIILMEIKRMVIEAGGYIKILTNDNNGNAISNNVGNINYAGVILSGEVQSYEILVNDHYLKLESELDTYIKEWIDKHRLGTDRLT